MTLHPAWLIPLLLGIVVFVPPLILFVQDLRATRTGRQRMREKERRLS